MGNTLISPPYPLMTVTSSQLYGHLTELRSWVKKMLPLVQEDCTAHEITYDLPKLGRTLKESYYTMNPVAAQFQNLMALRAIREFWDGIVRNYEDCWDIQARAGTTLQLVEAAIAVCDDAFTPAEHRERRHEREARKQMARLQRLHQFLMTGMGDDGDEENEEEAGGDGATG